jgi:4-coumarate--CoA ligase
MQELIKVSGLQVAPAELEALLLTHPSIADAAVVGITVHDEEFPRGYVVLQDDSKGKVTPEEIQEWVKDKAARHKWFAGGMVSENFLVWCNLRVLALCPRSRRLI